MDKGRNHYHVSWRGPIAAEYLKKIADAPPPDIPPLGIGERCRLNSGGPVCLVVDVETDSVTISWDGGMEATLPRACVRRIP